MNPKQNLLKTLSRGRAEWVPTPAIDGSMTVVSHGLREYPRGGGVDDWGVKWKQGEMGSGAGLPITHPISSPEDVEEYQFPDPNDPELMDPTKEAITKVDRETTLVFGDNGWGLFERAWILVGMDKFLTWMYQEPEAVVNLLNRIAEVKIIMSKRLIDEVGVDGIRYGDDWGGESQLMMGPDLWRKFILPRQRKLYETCKIRNVFIMQHADGHVEEIIPDLIDIGLDLLNPLQPECNDVEKVKREFGSRLSFHGAVGSRILARGTPTQVKNEVKLRIHQLSPGGGYVLAPAHAYSYPEENMRAFRKAAKKFGEIPDEWVQETISGKGDIEV